MKKTSNQKSNREQGIIDSLFSGIAKVTGFSHVTYQEVLADGQGQPIGMVIGYDKDSTDIVLFADDVRAGSAVFRTARQFSISVSEKLVGRVLDGFGIPRDGLPVIKGASAPVFADAVPIIDRAPVSVPLTTGIKLIDSALPLGRGQRELIIGDRKLGKSTIATDTVLYQKHADPPVICVYVLCGQKDEKIAELVRLFNAENAFLYTTLVATSSFSSFAEVYLAPFVGTAIAEYFRDRGKDVLIVYDDLSQHARSYRDIALLLKRAPGRETYPGDIFSLHASMLERSGNRAQKKGGGSITALPILETQEGDVTAFIPTNIISITDGQIYLENGLAQNGFLPAVNVGLSVSRVGSAAQPDNLKQVTGGLRLTLSQHRELQKLAQLETVTSEDSKKKIIRGKLMLELLKQQKHTFVSWEEQAVLFFGLSRGLFDELPTDSWPVFEKLLLDFLRYRHKKLIEHIHSGRWGDKLSEEISSVIAACKDEFSLTT